MQVLHSVDWWAWLHFANYWAHRYQSAFVGVVALWVAFQQLGIAKRQSSISQRQQKMSEDQQNTAKALATVKIDRFIAASMSVLSGIIADCHHTNTEEVDTDGFAIWSWSPAALGYFDSIAVPDDFDDLAALAFPDDATKLLHLAMAVTDVQALAREFRAEAWASGALAEQSGRDRSYAVKTNTALNKFFVACNKCGKLQPHARG